MTNALKRRILVVDDDGEVLLKFLPPLLQQRGFEVTTAQTLEQAEEEIRRGHAHFYVLDLYLTTTVEHLRETKIPALLAAIAAHGSGQPRAWMVWTGETKRKRIAREYSDKHSDQLFPKEDDFSLNVELIVRLFNERTPHNWQIPVEYNVGPETLTLSGGLKLEGTDLWADIEELLRLLIDRDGPFTKLTVTELLEQGYSRTLKLRVRPKVQGTGRPVEFVLKVGDADAVEREYGNYRRLVSSREFLPRVNALAPREVRRHRIGALLYEFARGAESLRDLFFACKTRKDADRLKKIVQKLFEVIANAWFRGVVPEEGQLQLSRAFSDEGEVRRDVGYLEGMVLGLCESHAAQAASVRLAFQERSVEIRRPYPSAELNSPVGLWITLPGHGDLHTGNVLVFERSVPVLIDFSETAENQALFRDFAKFEAHLALDLVPEPPDLQAIAQFIGWQIDGTSLALRADPARFSEGAKEDWPGGWALEAIALVRACFGRIIERYISAVYKTNGFPRELLVGYYLSLWREYVRAWRWMGRSSDLRRLQNLLTIDRIIDQCCRPASHKEKGN